MKQVTGFGGFFFRAADPDGLAAWYEQYFGINRVPKTYEEGSWWQEEGPTVFAPFPADTDYFGRQEQTWMINLRVRDLNALVRQLREAGIEVEVHPEVTPIGRFAHTHDPEGNPLELWEPSGAGAARPAGG